MHVLEDDGCKLCCRNDAEDSECEVYTAQDIDLTQGTPCYKGFCSSSVRASLCVMDDCGRTLLLFVFLFVHRIVNFRVCKTLMTSVLCFQGVDDVSAVCCVCGLFMTSMLYVVFVGCL